MARVKNASPVAEFSDIKVCYATTKGSAAHRDAINGTWYIATFVDVLSRHAHDHHLCDMLKIIGRTMDKFCDAVCSYEENGEFIQTISLEESGFNKKLYFNPGYYESGGNGNNQNVAGEDARM